MDTTAGDDFLGLCDQKSSCKHVSDFERLRSYGHCFNSRTRPRVNVVFRNQLAGDVLNFVAYRLRQLQLATRAVHNRAAAFSRTNFKHRSIQIKGNFTKLTLHLYFKCIMYYAGLLFCSVYCP